MDKELLRIVIIAVGASVILLMLVWGLFKSKKERREINFYDDHDPFDNIDSRLVMNINDDDFDIVSLQPEKDDFEVIPLGKKHAGTGVSLDSKEEYQHATETASSTGEVRARLNPEYLQTATQNTAKSTPPPVVEKKVLPALLQFSLVAKQGEKFTGPDLLDAFDYVGLVFGSVQVFERLDSENRVDYAVASMMGEGTFPKEHWETYHCPGVNFFMQPREVEDAAAVFDDLINTLGQLSALLHGDILDSDKQPLTEGTVNNLEARLQLYTQN
jgi:cell division protein ZipA